MKLLSQILGILILFWTVCVSLRGGEGGGVQKIYIAREGSDKVVTVNWSPKISLMDAISNGGGGSFRLIVHLWRHEDRHPIKVHRLSEKQLGNFLLKPDDVVILGFMDQARAEKIEGIPAVAQALKLGPKAPPAEVNVWLNF